MSFSNLKKKIKEKNNPTVMGLDPKLDFIPPHIIDKAVKEFGKTEKAAGEAVFEFNKILIDCCYDLIPAIKPQSAYFEMYGLEGLAALKKTVEYAKTKGLYVILDAKRGDIGSTAEAYSSAYLGKTNIFGEEKTLFDADCLTVNPYLGSDGVDPFIADCKKYDKSIFVLVKTSNKSSGEFQDRRFEGGTTLYETVADKIIEWGADNISECGYSKIGAVVGATYPEQLKQMREKMKNTFLLIPGYGTQGGGAEDVKYAFDSNGGGAIVNASRSIMCAYKKDGKPEAFGECARAEVIRMRDDILGAIK